MILMRRKALILITIAILVLGAIGLVWALDGRTADVVVGDAVGAPGETVQVPILVDSQGQLIESFQVNLAYDGVALLTPVGSAGSVPLPAAWVLTINEAASGDFRFLAIDISGTGAIITGDVIKVQFDIAPAASPGPIALSTSLVELSAMDADLLPVNVVDGTVTVTETGLAVNSVVILGLPSEIISVEVTPRTVKGAIGTVQQLTATATLNDGSQQDITGNIIWTSSNPAIATVTVGGKVTIVGVGNTTITGVFTP